VTIIPRGMGALGITMTRPLEDRYLMTEPELKDRLAFALGGRSAEEIMFGEISTGAQNDLEQATEVARAMVVDFGMSPKIGPLSFGQNGFRSREGRLLFPGERPDMSEETARLVDEEIARLVNEAHDRAKTILAKDRALLEKLAVVLTEREVIEGKQLRRYVEGHEPIPTTEELKREAEDRRNGDQETKDVTGPDIIMAPPEGAGTTQVPSRPD